MNSESTPKYDIATEMLEWAIRSFLSGKGYYSALHLAGAAEEVLSVYLRAPEHKLTPASEDFMSAFLHVRQPVDQKEKDDCAKWVIDRMNEPRNSVKHKRGHSDSSVDFDAGEEAADVIDRAISNYTKLLGKLPLRVIPSIGEFDAVRRANRELNRGTNA